MNKVSTEEARNILHKSSNEIARSLLGRISTVTNETLEVPAIHMDIESAHKNNTVSDQEYEALTRLCNDIIVNANAIRLPVYNAVTESVTGVFKKRIWTTSEPGTVMQFRNCVTDMYMLDMISLDEYIELNNEIDRYIQYTLSNGNVK